MRDPVKDGVVYVTVGSVSKTTIVLVVQIAGICFTQFGGWMP